VQDAPLIPFRKQASYLGIFWFDFIRDGVHRHDGQPILFRQAYRCQGTVAAQPRIRCDRRTFEVLAEFGGTRNRRAKLLAGSVIKGDTYRYIVSVIPDASFQNGLPGGFLQQGAIGNDLKTIRGPGCTPVGFSLLVLEGDE
jgi:hypothetical protein